MAFLIEALRCCVFLIACPFFSPPQGQPVLVIGRQRLEGTVVTLKTPLAVMCKERNAEGHVEGYVITHVLREKYVFKMRPQPVISEELRGKSSCTFLLCFHFYFFRIEFLEGTQSGDLLRLGTGSPLDGLADADVGLPLGVARFGRRFSAHAATRGHVVPSPVPRLELWKAKIHEHRGAARPRVP